MGRTRRFDPERRARIIDAALEVIAAEGVAGTSHRKVAARADIPLGSMTYHFASMEQLLREAFTRFARTITAQFEARLAAARDLPAAVEAVADIIHGAMPPADLVLTHELYALAAREPAYRDLVGEWLRHCQEALQRHFDPTTAHEINALIEGLALHRALGARTGDRELTLDAVRRLVSADASLHDAAR